MANLQTGVLILSSCLNNIQLARLATRKQPAHIGHLMQGRKAFDVDQRKHNLMNTNLIHLLYRATEPFQNRILAELG